MAFSKGMTAVEMKSEAAATGKRKPMFQRKPGMSVTIAVGSPKPGQESGDSESMGMQKRAMKHAMDRVKTPADPESMLAELDDLNHRVTMMEKWCKENGMDDGKDMQEEDQQHESDSGDYAEDKSPNEGDD
jgi:hypothetical protein